MVGRVRILGVVAAMALSVPLTSAQGHTFVRRLSKPQAMHYCEVAALDWLQKAPQDWDAWSFKGLGKVWRCSAYFTWIRHGRTYKTWTDYFELWPTGNYEHPFNYRHIGCSKGNLGDGTCFPPRWTVG